MNIMNHEMPQRADIYYPLVMDSSVNCDKFTYSWTIDSFHNSMYVFKNQTHISSPIFPQEETNGVEWSLLLYPNGENPECADDISIFLALQLGYPNKTIDFTITLLDAKGSTLQKRSIDGAEFKTGNHNVCWGFYDFYPKSKMLEILMDPSIKNTITILCEIDYKTGRQETAPKYLRHMADMLESGRFSDVTLICQGKRFDVHKIMLASRSPVFSVMFEHDMKEARESLVEIPDIEPEIMQELLRFIYHNKVDKLEEHACSLLMVATKYQIEELIDMCQKLMYENLSVKNAVDMLIFADHYNAKKVKIKAISFLVENMTEVTSTPQYNKLRLSYRHLMKEILTAMALREGEVRELKKLKNVKCFTSDDFEYYPTQTTMTVKSLMAREHGTHGLDTMLARRMIVWQSPSRSLPQY